MTRLGDILVAASAATEQQRTEAFLQHRKEGGRFGTALLEVGVPEEDIARALASQVDAAPAAGAELEVIRPEVLRLVSARAAQRLGLVPFRRDGRVLHVAMKNPRDLRAIDEVSLATGLDVRPFVALEARVDTALAKHYGARVEPRHVAAIRLTGVRREPAPAPAADQSTAPRRARSSTLRVVHPPPVFTAAAAPEAAPGPRAATPPPGERVDPWVSTDPRGVLLRQAVAPRTELVEDAVTLPQAAAARAPGPPAEPPDLVPDGPAPTVEERLAGEIGAAEAREDVVHAVLSAATGYVRRAAVFAVDGDNVVGWDARPEPETDLREFRLPLSEASVFATLRDTDGFYVGTYMDLPSTVKTLRALGSDGLGTMAVVPVTLKGKTVLYLWGESESYTRPPSVASLKRLAAMLATGLEIVRLKSRLYTL